MYKELLEYIVKSLVINNDVVQVEQTNTDAKLILRLKVAEEDIGRIIGKQGKVAQAIRTLIKSIGAKEKKKIVVKFVG